MTVPVPSEAVLAPPPGTNYIAAIEPSLNFLMIVTVWSSVLVPTTIALFLFSTPEVRKRPVFILNVASVVSGMALGALSMYNMRSAILARPIQTNVYIPYIILCILIPTFSESILVLRVLTVYPFPHLPPLRRAIIYGPILVFKLARLVVNIVFATRWSMDSASDSTNVLQTGQLAWRSPFAKTDWFLMLFDMSYVSLLFLLRLRVGTAARQTGIIDTEGSRTRTAIFRSYASRLKALFWIAASNFVFPVLLNMVQLIFVFRDPNFLDGAYVYFTNTYIQIIGVLLATLWTTGSRWYDTDQEHVTVGRSTIQFASARTHPPSSSFSNSTDSSNGRGEPSPSIYELKSRDVNVSSTSV